MFTDDHLRREIADILNRKPSATRKDIVEALYWRATLKWGRVPETVKVWYRHYNSPDEILAKYSPDQPRVPAGNSDGGQWTRDPNASEGGREAREREKRLFEDSKNPNKPMAVLKHPDGSYVRGPTGEIVAYPKAFPPEFFIMQGRSLAQRSVGDYSDLREVVLKLETDIRKFYHGQDWDMQRIFNEYGIHPINHELRDYSTIAIGLYSYGAMIPRYAILLSQALYAGFNSDFNPREKRSLLYFLPQRNYENTLIGYQLGYEIDAKSK